MNDELDKWRADKESAKLALHETANGAVRCSGPAQFHLDLFWKLSHLALTQDGFTELRLSSPMDSQQMVISPEAISEMLAVMDLLAFREALVFAQDVSLGAGEALADHGENYEDFRQQALSHYGAAVKLGVRKAELVALSSPSVEEAAQLPKVVAAEATQLRRARDLSAKVRRSVSAAEVRHMRSREAAEG